MLNNLYNSKGDLLYLYRISEVCCKNNENINITLMEELWRLIRIINRIKQILLFLSVVLFQAKTKLFYLKVENAKRCKAIYIHTYYMFTRGRFYNSEYYVKSVIQTELGIAFRTQQSKE